MNKFLLSKLFIILIAISSHCQNLVLNNSFENYNYASCNISNEFNDILIDWDSPNNMAGDVYFTNISQECYLYQPDSSYDGPIGAKGSETPSEGEVFVGIWVYTIDGLEQREYIRGQFSDVLEGGKTYKVKMKISLADYMESHIDELGILFSETQEVQTIGDLIDAEPQLIINSGLDVTEGWVEFDTKFTADADYEYFIIGNFNSDDDTVLSPNPKASGASSTYGAYYYIDEVSVELDISNSTNEIALSSIDIYPNPAIESILYRVNGGNISSYSILNQFGQTLKNEEIDNKEEGFIDCTSLSPGMYYLIGQDKNGLSLSTTKFIITQ